MVVDEILCRGCGYNLKGLPAHGLCPECGVAIRVSTDGDSLRASQPDWLAHLARWNGICAWMILLMAACVLIEAAVATQHVLILAAVALYQLWAVASWQSVRPEPSQQVLSRSQLFTRLATSLGQVLGIVGAIAVATGHSWPMPAGVAFMLTWICFICATAGQLRALAGLMQRAPWTGLSWRLSSCTNEFVICNSAAMLATVALYYYACLWMIAPVAAIYWAVRASLLILRTADMLRVEATLGEENWHYCHQVAAPASDADSRTTASNDSSS